MYCCKSERCQLSGYLKQDIRGTKRAGLFPRLKCLRYRTPELVPWLHALLTESSLYEHTPAKCNRALYVNMQNVHLLIVYIYIYLCKI